MPKEGIEPPTPCTSDTRSTTELLRPMGGERFELPAYQRHGFTDRFLHQFGYPPPKRPEGIEPSPSAWRADILPLYDDLALQPHAGRETRTLILWLEARDITLMRYPRAYCGGRSRTFVERLSAACSALELRHRRREGIGPSSAGPGCPLGAVRFPLAYRHMDPWRFELQPPGCDAGMLPLPLRTLVTSPAGIEPAPKSLEDSCPVH